MRNTFRYIIAILAGVVAFASCTKEMPGTEPVADGKERVITATFGYASKSTLDTDGLTPIFTDGDLITVTNGTATQVCTLRVSGTLSTFTTKLEGPLTAVYPKDAAVVSGNSITGVKVPSSQTGLFKDANIAMAEIAANSLSARFVNQTAILRFYVDKSIQVKHITITGSLNIANDGSNLNQIVVDADEALISTKTGGNPDPRLCYVAVLPCPVTGADITPNELIFTSVTNTQETVTRTTTAKLKTAGMYNAFIPYYIDLGAAGKWAYCNIGAFLPEEKGLYFSWGNVEGSANFVDDEGAYHQTDGYKDIAIHNYASIPVDPKYDAAYKHWGEGFRMPNGNGGEFGTLINNTNNTWGPLNGVNGYKFIDKNNEDNYVFFPATFPNPDRGMYWSRNKRMTNTASHLDFTASYLDAGNGSQGQSKCYRGRPVRAIYDGGPSVINDGYDDAGEY